MTGDSGTTGRGVGGPKMTAEARGTVRPSTLLLVALVVASLCFCCALLHAFIKGQAGISALARDRETVERFRLTDLALFTETRYTRNPSQADLCSPFQDNPVSLEHFPTGSLVRRRLPQGAVES